MGQTTGPRGYYRYTTDGGQEFAHQMDCDLAALVGAIAATGELLITLGASSRRPVSPRLIYLQAVDDPTVRKTIIVGNPASPFATATASQNVQIDGRTFETTGRKGESVQFSLGGCDVVPDP